MPNDEMIQALMMQELQPQQAQAPTAMEPGLLQKLMMLLSGQTGMQAERDRLQPPQNTTGPRG